MKGEVSSLVFFYILLSDKKKLGFRTFPERRIRQQLFQGLHTLGESRPTLNKGEKQETGELNSSDPLQYYRSMMDGRGRIGPMDHSVCVYEAKFISLLCQVFGF